MALKRTLYTFATADDEQTVMITPRDRLDLFNDCEAKSLSIDDMSVIEFNARLVFNAGRRTGVITDDDFDAWFDTIEALQSTPDTQASQGEGGATPAS